MKLPAELLAKVVHLLIWQDARPSSRDIERWDGDAPRLLPSDHPLYYIAAKKHRYAALNLTLRALQATSKDMQDVVQAEFRSFFKQIQPIPFALKYRCECEGSNEGERCQSCGLLHLAALECVEVGTTDESWWGTVDRDNRGLRQLHIDSAAWPTGQPALTALIGAGSTLELLNVSTARSRWPTEVPGEELFGCLSRSSSTLRFVQLNRIHPVFVDPSYLERKLGDPTIKMSLTRLAITTEAKGGTPMLRKFIELSSDTLEFLDLHGTWMDYDTPTPAATFVVLKYCRIGPHPNIFPNTWSCPALHTLHVKDVLLASEEQGVEFADRIRRIRRVARTLKCLQVYACQKQDPLFWHSDLKRRMEARGCRVILHVNSR